MYPSTTPRFTCLGGRRYASSSLSGPSRYLTGEEPREIKAYSSVLDHDGRFNTVEENISWTMKFPSGIVAACNTTYGGNMNGYFRVHGAKGSIEMLSAFNYDGMHLTGQIGRDQTIDELSPVREPMEFTRQADHFADSVWYDRTPKTPGEEGLRDIALMSEIYQAAGLPGLSRPELDRKDSIDDFNHG